MNSRGSKPHPEAVVNEALARLDGGTPISRIAADLGVSRASVRNWRDERDAGQRLIASSEAAESTDDGEVQGLNKIVALAQARVMQALPKASASQAGIVMGIAVDKRRAVSGVAHETPPVMRIVFGNDPEAVDLRDLARRSMARQVIWGYLQRTPLEARDAIAAFRELWPENPATART